jgi:hypothetical protein
VLEVHVKWFLNELLVSLIMPLLSSKSVYHFYFPEAFLQVKKLMEKIYSETEKQGKGKIMLHLPMKFENHAMNRENKFLRSWSG